MTVPNTGNPALNALVEMVDSEISIALDDATLPTQARNALVNSSLVIDTLLAEIRKKNEFITFMFPMPTPE